EDEGGPRRQADDRTNPLLARSLYAERGGAGGHDDERRPPHYRPAVDASPVVTARRRSKHSDSTMRDGAFRRPRLAGYGRLMYVPNAFREDDVGRLHGFLRAWSFALLVTNVDGVPVATHLPFVLDEHTSPRGRLIGHVARANP